MKTLLAALAAVLTPLALGTPDAAAAEDPAAHASVSEYDHIRTTLHGTGGPVAVLIPGMSTPGAVWDKTVAALADEMRLLVVEVRGMEGSRSPANEKPGMMPGIIAELAADLETRGLELARIVGHSFGGLLALKFGLDHPDQTAASW